MTGALHLIGSNEDCLIFRESFYIVHIKHKDSLFNKLTRKQQEAINILAIEQMRYNTPEERLSFRELLNKVCAKKLTEKFSEEIIARKQHYRLFEEVNNILKNTG